MLDLLVRGAIVLTLDPARPTAQRLGVWRGQIVGLDEELDGVGARASVDLGGRVVVPGFVDAHAHLAWAGAAAGALDLAGAGSVAEVLARVDAAARATPPDGWVDAVGYDQRPLGRHLTRADLDPVTHGRRFLAVHTSGHAQLVNTAVLEQITPPADGWPVGTVVAGGHPTGLFLEEASSLPAGVRSPFAVTDLVDALATAAARCAAEGVTTVAEAGVGGGLVTRSPLEGLAFQRAVASGRVPVRVVLMPSLDRVVPVDAHPADGVDAAFPLGLTSGFGSDRLRLGPVKAWLDGGMMARTAALSAPYVGDPDGGRGALAADLAGITRRAVAAHAGGWDLALHAIGDRAVDAGLDIVAAAQAAHPRPEARHRIEHAGLVRPDQLARFAALGVTAVVQPRFLYEFGDAYARDMGPERAPWLYRGRSFLDAGVALAGSSDRPVADGAPLRAMQFLRDRTTSSGAVVGPDEPLTTEQALHAHTLGAARSLRLEDRVGSVAAGKAADLVVLDADPRTAPDLGALEVLATVVAGEVVHGRWP